MLAPITEKSSNGDSDHSMLFAWRHSLDYLPAHKFKVLVIGQLQEFFYGKQMFCRGTHDIA